MTAKRKLIRMAQVIEQTGMSRTGIYELIEREEFPKQIKVGRVSLWAESDVQMWILDQIRRSRSSNNTTAA